MRIEDIDKDFRELESRRKEADELFRAGRMEEAEPIYRRVLELLKSTYGEEHSIGVSVQQNVGDIYYSIHKWNPALAAYEAAFRLSSAVPDCSAETRLALLFRVAKTHEKMGATGQADSTYARAKQLARSLGLTQDALYCNILESYAAMLRRARIRPDEATEMEEQAREIRQGAIMPADTSELLLSSLKSDPPSGSADGRKSSASSRVQFRDLSGKPRAVDRTHQGSGMVQRLLGTLSVFILSGTILGFVWLYTPTDTHLSHTLLAAQTANETHPNDEANFESADGLVSLASKDGNTCELRVNGRAVPGKVISRNAGWNDVLAALSGRQFWLRYTDPALEGEDHYPLYRTQSKEHFVQEKVHLLVAAAQKCFAKSSVYPSNMQELIKEEPGLEYTNPASNKADSPVMVQEPDVFGIKVALLTPEYFDSGLRLENRLMIDPEFEPCAIHGYAIKSATNNPLLYIMACDSRGNFLGADESGLAFPIKLADGRDVTAESSGAYKRSRLAQFHGHTLAIALSRISQTQAVQALACACAATFLFLASLLLLGGSIIRSATLSNEDWQIKVFWVCQILSIVLGIAALALRITVPNG